MKKTVLISFVCAAVIIVFYLAAMKRQVPNQITNRGDFQHSTLEIAIGDDTFTVELAVTDAQKSKGLSNRQSLPNGHGMLFVFKPPQKVSFWMKDMKFPIDIIWIKDRKIIGIERNISPPKFGVPTSDLDRYDSPEEVDYVLEINANASSKMKIGDPIAIKDSVGV